MKFVAVRVCESVFIDFRPFVVFSVLSFRGEVVRATEKAAVFANQSPSQRESESSVEREKQKRKSASTAAA